MRGDRAGRESVNTGCTELQFCYLGVHAHALAILPVESSDLGACRLGQVCCLERLAGRKRARDPALAGVDQLQALLDPVQPRIHPVEPAVNAC